MKHVSITAATLTAMLLTACSSENPLDIETTDSSAQLRITASMNVTSSKVSKRSAVTSFTTAPIGLFVDDATLGTTTAYTPASNSTAEVTTGAGGSTVGSSGSITAGKEIYLNATSAKVYAYYTGSANLASVPALTNPTYASKIPVTVLNSDAFDATGQNDYMWATPVTVSKASNTAALVFNHAMSKIIFNITPTNYAGTGALTNISLSDATVEHDATSYAFWADADGTEAGLGMDVEDGDFSGLTRTQTLSFTGNKTLANGAATTVEALVAPTSLSGATITLSITIDAQAYTATIPVSTVTAWAKSNQYTYAISLSGSSMTISEVSITDWTNTDITVAPLQ